MSSWTPVCTTRSSWSSSFQCRSARSSGVSSRRPAVVVLLLVPVGRTHRGSVAQAPVRPRGNTLDVARVTCNDVIIEKENIMRFPIEDAEFGEGGRGPSDGRTTPWPLRPPRRPRATGRGLRVRPGLRRRLRCRLRPGRVRPARPWPGPRARRAAGERARTCRPGSAGGCPTTGSPVRPRSPSTATRSSSWARCPTTAPPSRATRAPRWRPGSAGSPAGASRPASSGSRSPRRPSPATGARSPGARRSRTPARCSPRWPCR